MEAKWRIGLAHLRKAKPDAVDRLGRAVGVDVDAFVGEREDERRERVILETETKLGVLYLRDMLQAARKRRLAQQWMHVRPGQPCTACGARGILAGRLCGLCGGMGHWE